MNGTATDPDDIIDPHRPLRQHVDDLRTALHPVQMRDGRALVGTMPDVRGDLFRLYTASEGGQPERPLRDALAAFCDHVEGLTEAEPDAATLGSAPRLNRWSAIIDRDAVCLLGRVTGHPRLREGASARTSPVLRIAPAKGWA